MSEISREEPLPEGLRGGQRPGPLTSNGWDDVRWALAFVTPYRSTLVLVAALGLVSTALALYLPYLAKDLVDEALLGGDLGALARITGLFAGITLLSFGVNVVSGLRYTKASADILFDMRLAVFEHLQGLSPRFWARTPLGEVISRINSDVGEIQRVVAEMALGWFGNAVFLMGTIGMLLWLDWRLFLVSVSVLPLAVWALVHYRRRLEDRVALMRARSAEIGSFLIESMQGMRLVTGANAQGRERGRFRERNDTFVSSLMEMQRLRYLAGGLPALLLSVSTAFVFLVGGWRVVGGVITLGTFVAFMAYQMRLISPIQGLMGIYSNLATARVSLSRVRALLDTLPEVVEPERPVRLGAVRGELQVEDVGLSHGRGASILDGIGFCVAPGEVVAVVGRSGSGKSTLVDLLTRQIDPDRGRVLLDGHDLRALALEDVRRSVVTVEQEPFVFHASVGDNIRYARPDATDAAVEQASRAAGIHDFIASLPNGYHTTVGERGAALSAGERQRIALARAFLADPAVLILDETTANLEPVAEEQVVRGYRAVMRDRTTLLVSHRLELVRGADRVLVMEDGRVVRDAPPDEVIGSDPGFERIFGTAAGGARRSRGAHLGTSA